MRTRIVGLASAVTLAVIPAAAHATNEDGQVVGFKRLPIQGTTSKGALTALFDVQRFQQASNGTICAVGILHDIAVAGRNFPNRVNLAFPVQGTGTDCSGVGGGPGHEAGDDVRGGFGGLGALRGGTSAQPAVYHGTVTPRIVLAQTPPTCPILNLVLGPLHLDLLGLVVDLNQVVLNITAVPGAGNLLGNLLCAVANLLNGVTPGAGATNVGALLTAVLNGLVTFLQSLGL